MELTLNEILPDDITKINYTLKPPSFEGDARATQIAIEILARLIDQLGEHSAAAQGLNRVITTAEKLRNAPDNTLFLLKSSCLFQGNGALIGLLKVGYKRLYLFDNRNVVREVEPLCVLDFFIAPDHQRLGYGRVLFDYMLTNLEVHPYELAIDGPSPKMEQFLAKNYGVDNLLRQNNNFAVAPQFFDTAVDISSRSGRSTPAIAAAVGRFAAPKPESAIASVIHGGTSYYTDSNNGGTAGLSGTGMACTVGRFAATKPASDIASVIHGDNSNDDDEDFYSGWENEWDDEEELAPQNEEMQHLQEQNWDEEETWNDEVWPPTNNSAEKEKAEKEGQEKQPSPDRPSILHVEPPAPPAFADVPAAGLPSGGNTPNGGNNQNSQKTDKGFRDVKYYHNRLW